MESKARGTKAESRSCPGTLGSDAAGPSGVGWFLGVQLPESLVGDRANSFDCHDQSFGSKITRFSGHGVQGQGNQSRESELPWDSRLWFPWPWTPCPENLVILDPKLWSWQSNEFALSPTRLSGS